uniref:Pleckstrin and Sec7 domain containing 3 n=1 Tax=Ornithorhynchus anatinus TaxID=9258 RepID=A0A6I8N5L1_ORNAN
MCFASHCVYSQISSSKFNGTSSLSSHPPPLGQKPVPWAHLAGSHKAPNCRNVTILAQKNSDLSGDHGGSTLLPPNVTNEFPEYGTMEESGEALRVSLEFEPETLQCRPSGQEGGQLLVGPQHRFGSVAERPECGLEGTSTRHLNKRSLQPIDSLTPALKATEINLAPGAFPATKILDVDAVSVFPAKQMEKGLETASKETQGANKPSLAGQEKTPEIPLPAEVTVEENFYLLIEKDLAALLTGETQPKLLQVTNDENGEALREKRTIRPTPSVETATLEHKVEGTLGAMGDGRFEYKKEPQGRDPSRAHRPRESVVSTSRPAKNKHVGFQGVEILRTGGEKGETRHNAGEGMTAPVARKEFSKGSSHCIPRGIFPESVGVTEAVWDEPWQGVTNRPGTSSGKSFPSLLVEGGEEEAFLKENKKHLETKAVPEREMERLTQVEKMTKGEEDDNVHRYTEDSTDVYSSQFENILDNTSLYYSAESLETLYSEPDSYFSFEMPLTPMIQQRIKEGSHFLERTMGTGPQDILSVSADGGIVMGYSEITNGLNDTGETVFRKGIPEVALWGSNAGVKSHLLETNVEMGSTEFLEKESTENISNGTSSNLEAARRLAKRLYELDRFRRSDVAKHLGKNNEFSKLVAEEYLKFFDFTGMTLDQSLRCFFKAFSLMGETQERERVLIHFSNRYFQCNPNTISSQDGVHCLTCAMMLLNTDLHGHNIGKKMSCQEFIANLHGVNEGEDFPRGLLKALYNSIKNEKLEWAVDDEEKKKSPSEGTDEKANGTQPKTVSRIGSTSNPFLDIPHDPNAAVYKTGFLARKIHADMDGKKTPRGKRGWKTFYAVLKGTVLYLQKDEYKPEKALSEDDLKNAVSVHHALASKATDYEKRPNVLKLKTADWRVLLFQAQNPEEMQAWINKINCVAAVFSAPPFPAAIGSQKKFSRPLLPATTTKLSQDEQLKSHEGKLKQISTELTEHRSYPPDKKVKAKEIDEYKLKDHYLEFEKTRYEMYVKLLKEGGKLLLSSGENDGTGLKKSHSSPSLNQESSPLCAKVKRNVSERKDYRPETPSIKQKVT